MLYYSVQEKNEKIYGSLGTYKGILLGDIIYNWYKMPNVRISPKEKVVGEVGKSYTYQTYEEYGKLKSDLEKEKKLISDAYDDGIYKKKISNYINFKYQNLYGFRNENEIDFIKLITDTPDGKIRDVTEIHSFGKGTKLKPYPKSSHNTGYYVSKFFPIMSRNLDSFLYAAEMLKELYGGDLEYEYDIDNAKRVLEIE